MLKSPAAYIFLCRDTTHDECLEKNLFGGQKDYYKQTGEISEEVPLFLYNFSAHLLEGVFISTSKADWNVVPEAWKGKYPWQIRCKRTQEFTPLMKSELITVLGNYRKYPKAILDEKELQELIQLFEQKSLLSEEEKMLRLQLPQNIHCYDGHMVRSKPEKDIDDWLYDHRICHGYEPELPFREVEKNADFIVHIPGKKDVYIEYWGLKTSEYEENKKRKIELYNRYNLELLEICPENLKNLSSLLSERLLSSSS